MSVYPETSSKPSVITAQNQVDFSTGLFSCFSDCKTCICGLLCLPCMMCTLTKRMDEGWCSCLCLPNLRTKMRTMYGIKGSVCTDVLVSNYCYACAACQLERELTHVGL